MASCDLSPIPALIISKIILNIDHNYAIAYFQSKGWVGTLTTLPVMFVQAVLFFCRER
jgi:hypothetical protein